MNTLVEAAAQMFSREGFAATTNRIAERAGLSVGTLYQYFPDKSALLHAVVDLHRDGPRLHALLHRMAQPTAEQLDELRGFEERICDEVAFHLKRCDGGGDDDDEMTAQTLVHAIDAQLHRVMTRRGFDVDALARHGRPACSTARLSTVRVASRS